MRSLLRALQVFLVAPALAMSERPNFLVVMVDDMGFSDPGCYGGEIDTPNLDKLASGGLRFTQFYNTARCWPSRAALITGRYPHEAGHAMMYGPQRLLARIAERRPNKDASFRNSCGPPAIARTTLVSGICTAESLGSQRRESTPVRSTTIHGRLAEGSTSPTA